MVPNEIVGEILRDIDLMFGLPPAGPIQGEPVFKRIVLNITYPPDWPKDPTGMTWREPLPMCHCEGD
jgi:hypothetical protein